MNKTQQLALVDYFDSVRKAQSAQQKIKARLWRGHKGLKGLFKKIAGQNKVILPLTLKEYLEGKLLTTENDLYVVFGKFDGERTGRLPFEAFKEQLAPIHQLPAANEPILEEEFESTFLQLLQSYVYHEDVLDVARKCLKQIVPYQAFDQIATESKGYIGREQLLAFYRQNGVKIKEKGLSLLLHGLRRRTYRNVTLEAFCENIDPMGMGYYTEYQRAIDEDQQLRRIFQQKKEAEEMRSRKKLQDKMLRKQSKNQRIREAEQNRSMHVEQLRKLKQRAEKEREERQILQKALQTEQKMRHELEKQIELFKLEAECNGNDRRLLDRLRDIRNEQLAESRLLQQKVQNQQKCLDALKYRVTLQKGQLYSQSLRNQERIGYLKSEKQNDGMRQLEEEQQPLMSRLLSSVTPKSLLRNQPKVVGKIYKSSKCSNTPTSGLYGSGLGLGSAGGLLNSNIYCSYPQLHSWHLSRY